MMFTKYEFWILKQQQKQSSFEPNAQISYKVNFLIPRIFSITRIPKKTTSNVFNRYYKLSASSRWIFNNDRVISTKRRERKNEGYWSIQLGKLHVENQGGRTNTTTSKKMIKVTSRIVFDGNELNRDTWNIIM